jgi:hypothetical protein
MVGVGTVRLASRTRLAHVTVASRARYFYNYLDFKNKILHKIEAVRTNSKRCSSVRTERYFDLMYFRAENRQTRQCVVSKMKVSL